MYSAVFRVYVHVVSEQKKTGRLYLLRRLSYIMFTCMFTSVYLQLCASKGSCGSFVAV